MTSVKEPIATDSDAPARSEDPEQYPKWLTALWLIPLTLAVLTPGLRLQAYQSLHAFRLVPFLYTVPVVAAVGVLVFAGLSRGFRVRIHWALGVTTMVLVVGFLQADLNFAMAEVAGSAPRLVLEVVPVLVAVLALWMAARMASTPGYFVIIALATTAIFVSVGLTNARTVVAVPALPQAAVADPASPDVLLMILDGYARDDVLAEHYGYDNEPFLAALADRGFIVPRNAAANYTGTYGALAAVYGMAYPVGAGRMSSTDHDRISATLAGDNAMMRAFHGAGYDITFLENGWEGSACPPAADRCIRDGLWGKTFWDLGDLTLLSPVVQGRWVHPFTAMAATQFDRLIEIASEPDDAATPRLIVAHVTVPHPPLHLDATCTLSNSPGARELLIGFPGLSQEELDARKALYVDQIACVNAQTLAAVDAFLDHDADGIVMIAGDHGPDSMLQAFTDPYQWTRAAVTERATIVSAYRVADACAGFVSDDMTPVNGARLVHSCALDMPFEALPNRSYTIPAPSDDLQDVLDLGDRLDRND